MIAAETKSYIKTLAAFVAAVPLVLASQAAHAQAGSQEVQIFRLVAQAEHVARKCDAFTLEGQFLYREFKRRLLNAFTQPLFDSISRAEAPTFWGTCSDIAAKPAATTVVDYFNNEGARMLALHHFLPENSPCTHANTPVVRQRAAAAWKAISPSQDPRLQPAAMQREADMIASQCNLSNAGERRSAHAAAFMAETLKPLYDKPASYRGEMTVTGSEEYPVTFIDAVRDPTAQIVKGGVLSGLTQGNLADNHVAILKDGRLALVQGEGSVGLLGIAAVEFRAGGKKYPAAEAHSIDPRFKKLFILDAESSKAILDQSGERPSFWIDLTDANGETGAWEEDYESTVGKRGEVRMSRRPISFDTKAFKAALQYTNAPNFR